MSSVNSDHHLQSSEFNREQPLPRETCLRSSPPQDPRKRKLPWKYGNVEKSSRKQSTASKSDSVKGDLNITSVNSSTQEAGSPIEKNQIDPNLTDPLEVIPWNQDTNDSLASNDGHKQVNEQGDDQKVKQWEQNIRRQVKVCPLNCLREVVDRVCYTKEPVNDKVLLAIVDYVKLPSKLADLIYQIVLGVCMIDYDNICDNLEKNHRFNFFGCDFCLHCFNVLFMKSQPQDRKRSQKREFTPEYKYEEKVEDRIVQLVNYRKSPEKTKIVDQKHHPPNDDNCKVSDIVDDRIDSISKDVRDRSMYDNYKKQNKEEKLQNFCINGAYDESGLDTLVDRAMRKQNLDQSQRPNVERWFRGVSYARPSHDSKVARELQRKDITQRNKVKKVQDSESNRRNRRSTRPNPRPSSTSNRNYSSQRTSYRRAARY